MLGEHFAREMGRGGDINQENGEVFMQNDSNFFVFISECATFAALLGNNDSK